MSNTLGVFQLPAYVVAILAIITVVSYVIAFVTASVITPPVWRETRRTVLNDPRVALAPFMIGLITGLVSLVTWWTTPGTWADVDSNPRWFFAVATGIIFIVVSGILIYTVIEED